MQKGERKTCLVEIWRKEEWEGERFAFAQCLRLTTAARAPTNERNEQIFQLDSPLPPLIITQGLPVQFSIKIGRIDAEFILDLLQQLDYQ